MHDFVNSLLLGPAVFDKNVHFQRKYNWELVLPHDFGGIFGVSVANLCYDIQFGDYSTAEFSSRRYGAFQQFFAGIQTIDTVKLSFWQTETAIPFMYFKNWRSKVVDDIGYYYPKKNYAKDVYVKLQSRSGYTTLYIRLVNAFPVVNTKFNLSYLDESVLPLNYELSVDRILVQ